MPSNAQIEPEEPESVHPALSLPSIRRTILKRKVRIGIVWVLLTACTVIVVRRLPSVYLAETVVLIDSQQIPEKFVSPTVASDVDNRIAAIRELLLSSGELKKVIDEFGLYKEQRKARFEEEILDMMRKDISITMDPIETSNKSRDQRNAAFRIGFQGPDPQLVARVANRLTDLYVAENLKTRESQAAGTSEFLDSQLKEAKGRLDRLEETVSAYKLQHNGELPQQEATLSGTLSRLQTQLETNRDAIDRAQQTKIIVESTLNSLSAMLAAQTTAWQEARQHASDPNAAYLSLGQQGMAPQRPPKKTSEALEEQLAVLLARDRPDHPDVIRLKADIEKIQRLETQQETDAAGRASAADTASATEPSAKQPWKASGRGQTPSAAALREPPELAHMREQVVGLDAQVKGSEKEVADRKAEQERILRDIASYQHHLELLPVREQQMAQVTRDYAMAKDDYKSLLDKKMAADMSLAMERRQQSERFVVLDRAQIPEKPIKPKRPILYGAGAGLSLVLGLLMGIISEMRKNVVLGEWELPRRRPSIGAVTLYQGSAAQRWTEPKGQTTVVWTQEAYCG